MPAKSSVLPVEPSGQPGLVLNLQYTPPAVCSAPLVLQFACHDPELSVALTPGSDQTKTE